MSEFLTDQKRKALLKQIILDLHAGASVESVKPRFQRLLGDVSAVEITAMEQELIHEGLPAEQVKELCDVHVAVFQASLDSQTSPETTPGHPVHTFKMENFAVSELLSVLDDVMARLPDAAAMRQAAALLEQLSQVKRIYLRKENLLFPMLEKHDVGGPSSVMWAIHDDIRNGLNTLERQLANQDYDSARATYRTVAEAIRQLIYKEEHILYPTALQVLTEEEWANIRDQSAEIGYCLIIPGHAWQPAAPAVEHATPPSHAGTLPLDVGGLSLEQINLMLQTLPVEITYVDENDTVRYYSQGRADRIFQRSPAIIGRKVQNCHSPKSLAAVNHVIEDLRSGKRDHADSWIQTNGRFILIRYFAIRDSQGVFRGTLEVSQDITEMRALQGEHRLMD